MRSAIRPVLATEVPALAAAMGRAFFDDPGAIFVEPDVSRRAQVNAGFFAVFIRLGLALGEVVATPDLAGVAVWLPPAHPTASETRASGAYRMRRHTSTVFLALSGG